MYSELYTRGLYKPLWQMWDGKPLVLGNSSEADPVYRQFFTWRQSWAWTAGQDWFGNGHDAWPVSCCTASQAGLRDAFQLPALIFGPVLSLRLQWIDWYPQGYGWHEAESRKEEMPIAVAGWPLSNLGKSYDGPSPPAQLLSLSSLQS